MSEHKTPPGEPEASATGDERVEALVRAYLERQEATVDARQVLAGVHDRNRAGVGRRASSRRRWGWSLAMAAGLLIAALVTLQLGIAQASAETLVREAQQAHALPVDRHYRIDIEPEQAMLERFPLLQPHQETLWTRGDRFWIESQFPGRPWAWGQDAQDRVWFAFFPDRGVRFEADEIPEVLAAGVSVRSLQLETLLQEVLRDFDLRREPAEGKTYRVRATLKPDHGHRTLSAALIEIDADSKVVQRLTLWRTFRGQDVARVTFTLIGTGSQSNAAYQLEGHLDEGAVIYTRAQKLQRFKTLVEHFGPLMKKFL